MLAMRRQRRGQWKGVVFCGSASRLVKEARMAQAGGSEAEEISEKATIERGTWRSLWAERRGGSWRPGQLYGLLTKIFETHRVVAG